MLRNHGLNPTGNGSIAQNRGLWVNPRVETLGYYRIVPTGLKTLAQDFNPGWALGGRLRRRA